MAECCAVVCCRRALAEALREAFRGALAGTPASFESIKGFPFRCVCSSVWSSPVGLCLCDIDGRPRLLYQSSNHDYVIMWKRTSNL